MHSRRNFQRLNRQTLNFMLFAKNTTIDLKQNYNGSLRHPFLFLSADPIHLWNLISQKSTVSKPVVCALTVVIQCRIESSVQSDRSVPSSRILRKSICKMLRIPNQLPFWSFKRHIIHSDGISQVDFACEVYKLVYRITKATMLPWIANTSLHSDAVVPFVAS